MLWKGRRGGEGKGEGRRVRWEGEGRRGEGAGRERGGEGGEREKVKGRRGRGVSSVGH